jgi:molybdate transport system permease protein
VIGDALRLSAQVTAVATVLIVVIGLPLGRLLARRSFPGKSVLDALILLPLVLPPSVVGYYLLVGMGDMNPLVAASGWNLLFTWQAAAVASTLVGLPLMVQATRAALESVDPVLEQAARVCGASEVEVFFRITLPLAGRGVVAGIILGAARAFGEFGATLMVAGSIPGRTQTLPLAIYDAVQAGRMGDAHTLVLLTSVLAFISIWVVRRMETQSRSRRQAYAPHGPPVS